MKILLLSTFFGLAYAQCNVTLPQVTIESGVIEGFCVTNSPMEVNAFLSVPFADPPARFAKPQPKTNWTGVLSTKTMPPRCMQSGTSDPVSEDCLYLNVFAPATGSGYPVIVVVYGGAFATGGARNQGTPDHIAKHIVSTGVVVVVIQYRVGPLGFCTTGDSVMPGNYGMWDAAIALQWVQDNVGAFGGDKDSVTLWGGSAGADLIEGLHLSPYTTNLFHKMILFSGAAQNMWDAPVIPNCQARASSIGLTWNSSETFLAAMTSAPATSLEGGWQIIGESGFQDLLTDWSPVYDGDFFPATGAEMRAAASSKPIIFGISFLDGSGLSSAINITHNTLDEIVDYMVPAAIQNRSVLQQYFLDSYRTQAALLEPTAQDKHAMQAAFGERTIAAAIDLVARRYMELFGDDQIMYRYVFKHFDPASVGASYPYISFATHGFDQYYFLGPTTFNYTASDMIVRDIVCTAFTNFAKFSDPNGNGTTTDLPIEWVAATSAQASLNFVFETEPWMDYEFFHGRPYLNNLLNQIAGTSFDV